jgi:hypothetical protein
MPTNAAYNRAQLAAGRLRLEMLGLAIKHAVADEAEWVGQAVVNVIQAQLARPVFPRSAPGGWPARETGRLSGLAPSFNARPSALRKGTGSPATGYQFSVDVNRALDNVSIEIGSPMEYAPYLEMGTRRMAARPHLRRAADIVEPTIGPRLASAIVAAETRVATGSRVA